jgi:hypothetical protein
VSYPPREGDLPLEEAEKVTQPLLDVGAIVFFKFTCANCGSRQTFEFPNIIYMSGSCDECGHVTDLRDRGVGFMMVK